MPEALSCLLLLTGVLAWSSGGGVALAAWTTTAALWPESSLEVDGP